jgi:transcription termination/antitermination protein NusA
MLNLVETFAEFKDNKGIDRAIMIRVLEDVFRTLIRKKYNHDDNFDVIMNPDKGDLEIWRRREIVEDGTVADELTQIALTDARRTEADYEVGEECFEPFKIEEFGRRAIMAARQTLVSRIMELEKEEIYKKYKDRTGDLIIGEVSQVSKRELLVVDDLTNNELLLPRSELIRGDFYRKGDMIRAVVSRVEMKNGSPSVVLSRTDERFLERLMEAEVVEIEEGIIVIKGIVRQPGERAKVAVESLNDDVDPIGACVGQKGSRIHGIVRELRNENIDIVNYTTNQSLLIQRALTPAKVTSVELDHENKRAAVYLRPDEVSKAIGKGGMNIKLASKLCGFEIDVFRDTDEIEDDIELDEFADEIDGWVLDEFKRIGCDTARSVLAHNIEELARRTDLEEETVREVVNILREELDNAAE